MSESRVSIPVCRWLGTNNLVRDVCSAFTLSSVFRGYDAFLQIPAWGVRPVFIRKAKWLPWLSWHGALGGPQRNGVLFYCCHAKLQEKAPWQKR